MFSGIPRGALEVYILIHSSACNRNMHRTEFCTLRIIKARGFYGTSALQLAFSPVETSRYRIHTSFLLTIACPYGFGIHVIVIFMVFLFGLNSEAR